MATVLFLGGFGRSGTTLVERILGELPGVCPLGEVAHLWRRDVRNDERCGCGARFSTCDFWGAVGYEAFGGWERLDLDRVLTLRAAVERTRLIPRLANGRFTAHWQTKLTEYASYYKAVYAAAARVSGARVVVDSSKHSALAHCLRWTSPTAGPGDNPMTCAGALDLRVVQVVRDPRAVAYSWARTVAHPEIDATDLLTRYRPSRSALLWTAHHAAFDLLARRGVPVWRLRYEDLVADPPWVVRELAGFAGLDLSEDPLTFLGDGFVELGVGHSATINPMRRTAGRVALSGDEAWREFLPPSARRLVGVVCAPLLRRYGYRIRRTTAATAAPPTPPPARSHAR